MPSPPDDWPKLRTHGQRLTREERKFIREARRQGFRPKAIAKALRCATRNVQIHFRRLRLAEQRPPPAPVSRFYTSNFEL